MNVDELVRHLELLNESYKWIIDEGSKIYEEINKTTSSAKLLKLQRKYNELQKRHASNAALYQEMIGKSKTYFKEKYNIDLISYLENKFDL